MKALVLGAGGFIGNHMVKRLKSEGHWVRGVDLKHPEFDQTLADEFQLMDLRDARLVREAFRVEGGFSEIYQFAADMGGLDLYLPANTMPTSCTIQQP